MQDMPTDRNVQQQYPPDEGTKPIHRCEDDSAVFPYVVKLLTGELLGHVQYLDHHSKIEPVVRHAVPEIPKTSFLNNQLQLCNVQNITGDKNTSWNYGKTYLVNNRPEFSNGTYELYGKKLIFYYSPTCWQQFSNNTPNNCKSISMLQCASQNCVNSGASELWRRRTALYERSHVVDMKGIRNNGIEKILPELQQKPALPNVVNSTVFTLLMENTGKQKFGGNSRRNVNGIARTRRTTERRMPLRNMTRNIRYGL